ncbi:MAG: 5' DNA nuclease [Rhizobium sp.]|nr:5' DNA nuclease [Rhizobium sp.]
MASGSDKDGKGQPGDPVDEPPVSDATDPLMNPAAALAAATAFGFGMAAQMSRFFLGSLQGAMDLTGELARQLEEERKAKEASTAPEPAQQPEPVVTPEVVTKKLKVKAAPAAPKPKTVKASPAKAQPKTVTKVAAKPEPEVSKPVAKAKAAPKTKVPERPEAVTTAKAVKVAKSEAPEKTIKAAPARKAGKANDLKRIDGIGPKLEQMLKGRGISGFQQIAEMGPDALAALDTELGLDGRTLRDDWTGQAKRLAGGKARTGK